MLRITIHNETGVIRFILEGRLMGEWVQELERCWRQAAATQPPPPVLVELNDVRFVDEAGRKLLSTMARADAELIAIDLEMKAILEEIIEGGRTNETYD